MSEITITGLADLKKMLDTLPAKIEKNILRGALRAGSKLILDQAKADCPVGPPSKEGRRLYRLYEGALRDSLRLSFKKKGGWLNYRIIAGGKNKKNGAVVFYAHLIEFTGATRHEITSRKFGSLFIGGLFRKSANHPGMQKKPFMRPALDNKSEAAIVAVGNYIKNRLTKRGLDTSDINVKGEE